MCSYLYCVQCMLGTVVRKQLLAAPAPVAYWGSLLCAVRAAE